MSVKSEYKTTPNNQKAYELKLALSWLALLSGIDSVAKAHTNFKRVIDWSHESGFRYVLHSNGDKNRELILTVLVFHVPE
ncbi:hypothetical protein BA022_04705 [Diaphorobacter nitroreducens]|uniref:hypothetical protein n=1 Tax=Diaphorobacter nitroreducens TaxID=164759 RepID=UPI000B599B37|nr:hypothetical protein [Diaphorobacter nitroreducens]ASI67939.1 hypothetical protein BA022_04705 [Diaphorobacter nitroreducens]